MFLKDYVAPRGMRSELAASLGVPPQLVGQWANGTRPIPDERGPSIERATNGAVCCEDMCPNVNWYRIPDPGWPHPRGRPAIDVAVSLVEGEGANE